MFKIIAVALTLAFVTLCSGCQHKTLAKVKSPIVPKSLQGEYEQFQFAPAVRAGDMLYLSGVVARVEDADKGDISLSIARAFDEIEMVMKAAGATWSDVVDVTSYMTDLDNQIGLLWQIKEQRVPAPYPAWTAIGVASLYGGPQAIIEIKVTAYLPN